MALKGLLPQPTAMRGPGVNDAHANVRHGLLNVVFEALRVHDKTADGKQRITTPELAILTLLFLLGGGDQCGLETVNSGP